MALDRLLRRDIRVWGVEVAEEVQVNGYRATVCAVVSVCLVLLPWMHIPRIAYADPMLEEADRGHRTGANFLLNYTPPDLVNDPPEGALGAGELNMQELFPGYTDPSDYSSLEGLGSDPAALSTQGVATQFSLQSGTDTTSEAYQSLQQSTVNPHSGSMDIASELLIDVSRPILAGTDPLLDSIITGCVDDITAGDDGEDRIVHLEDIWTCTQAQVDTFGECRVERAYALEARETRRVFEIQGCGAGSGNDINYHDPNGWTGVELDFAGPPATDGAHICISVDPSPPGDYYATTLVDLGALGGWVTISVNTGYCGDFSVDAPSTSQCEATANWHEHLCRNELWDLNPARGPIGSCADQETSNWGADPNIPVDYTGCDADRIAYCTAVRNEYLSECQGDTCVGNGEEHWDEFFPAPLPGQVGLCEVNFTEPEGFDPTLPPGPFFVTNYFDEFFPGEPRANDTYTWIEKYCGTHDGRTQAEIVAACNASGNALESRCRNTVVDGTNILLFQLPGPGAGNCVPPIAPGPPFDYAGCPAGRQQTCQSARDAHIAACLGSAGVSLTGTETITASGLGSGAPELLIGQDLFGESVNVLEDGFNPGSLGLLAGDYVIANHTVGGSGIIDWDIDNGGSYGSNWDYIFTVTLEDSDELYVDATIYEIVTNGFVFDGCSQSDMQLLQNGTCGGAVTCTDFSPCREIDGVTLCEPPDPSEGITETLSTWTTFTTGVPEMCWEVEAQFDDCLLERDCIGNDSCVEACEHLPPELQATCLEDPCWVDAQGNLVCLDNTIDQMTNSLGQPGWVDDCEEFVLDPDCTLLPDMACIEGMEDEVDPLNIGLCLARTRFFDCGSSVTIPGVPEADSSTVTCGAEIRCLGDECANQEAESNPDFVLAATAATAITEAQKDVSCDVAGDPESCVLFEGTDERCQNPRGFTLGVIPDCCRESRRAGRSGGDFVTYMLLARHTYRLAKDPHVAAYLSQSTIGSGIQTVINTPAEWGRSAGRAVTSGFNSSLQWAGFRPTDAAASAPGASAEAALSSTGFGPIQQYIATGFNNFLNSIGAGEFASSIFETGGEGLVTGWVAGSTAEMVANVMTTIGTIYTIYSIARILGSIFFPCKTEELAFGIQQANRSCHYVGKYCAKRVRIGLIRKCIIDKETYCCFSSPFARIINQQVRLQGLVGEWGSAREPNCDGLSIAEMNMVDWSLVDLSEWEAILWEAGLVPDPRNPPLNYIPSDRIPGEASGGSPGMTATELAEEQIDIAMPFFETHREDLKTAPLYQPDPELLPWFDDGGP